MFESQKQNHVCVCTCVRMCMGLSCPCKFGGLKFLQSQPLTFRPDFFFWWQYNVKIFYVTNIKIFNEIFYLFLLTVSEIWSLSYTLRASKFPLAMPFTPRSGQMPKLALLVSFLTFRPLSFSI